MLFVAIDPGVDGGLAFCTFKGNLSACLPMPTVQRITNKKNKRFLDPDSLRDTLTAYSPAFAVLELVSAFPGQGVTSMFNFGVGFGLLQGVLGTLDIPVEYVVPVVWKRHHGLLKQDKKAAFETLKKIVGGKQLHSGAADAALMALWKANQMEARKCTRKPQKR